MKMTLAAYNLTTTNVPKNETTFSQRDEPRGRADAKFRAHHRLQGYSGETAFATDGHIPVHMSERDLAYGFRQKQFVNPLERGHIAFRTDDIAASRSFSIEKDIPCSIMARGP